MSQSTSSRLTDRRFWEHEYYWGAEAGELPLRVDLRQPFDRSLALALEAWAPATLHERVLEIGCAPAKWLIFYAESFGASVSGIEYSGKGAELSRENLRQAEVQGEIEQADFFSIEPRPYNLVLSIGFIEHFTDLDGVFARHVEFMAPGGRLALGVPNFTGVNRILQSVADREYLERHNRAAMSRRLYRRLAVEHGLTLERSGHIGGFDPSIIRLASGRGRLHPRRLVPGAVTLAERRFRMTALGERLQHPWMSSYLLTTFRRPG